MEYNTGTRWTDEDEKRLYHLYKRGWTANSIARDLGRTGNAIRARLRYTYGIELNDSNNGQSYHHTYNRNNNDSLFEQLRKWRFKESQDRGVPAYYVFSDATLYEIADKKPTTKSQLSNVYGVGAVKLEEFGYDVIQMVKKHCI